MINRSINMFNVPLFHFSLDWNKEIKEKIIKKAILDRPDYQWKDGGVYTDYSNTLPAYYEYVFSVIGGALDEFYKEINIRLKVKEMFYQLYKKGSYHLVHNHGSLGFSGILFVSFNEDLHTATRFYSPFSNFIDGSVIGYRPVVKEGDLLIWPSSILHEAESNHSEEERIIISFNLSN